MPHGISGFRARRLAREIDRFFINLMRRLDTLSEAQRAVESQKHKDLSFVDSTDLQAYLLGGPNVSSVPFGGTARMPDKETIIHAAEAFGRAMNKPELLELAAAVRKRGL